MSDGARLLEVLRVGTGSTGALSLQEEGAMKVIITRVQRLEVPEEFVVEATIDGTPRSITLRVWLPGAHSVIGVGGDLGCISGYTYAGREIARRVIRMYNGEALAFPIDLGDI